MENRWWRWRCVLGIIWGGNVLQIQKAIPVCFPGLFWAGFIEFNSRIREKVNIVFECSNSEFQFLYSQPFRRNLYCITSVCESVSVLLFLRYRSALQLHGMCVHFHCTEGQIPCRVYICYIYVHDSLCLLWSLCSYLVSCMS